MLYYIDCQDITQDRQLHEYLSRELCFPRWYGHNLDALYDCLTERTDVIQLVLCHWDESFPGASGIKAVLEQAQLDNPCFTVLFQ